MNHSQNLGLRGLLVSVKSTFDRNRAFLSFELLLGSKEQFKYVFKIKSTHNHAALKSFICFFNEKIATRSRLERKRRKRARVNWLKKGDGNTVRSLTTGDE